MSRDIPLLLAQALPWSATRLGAGVLLLLWIAALAIFSARELRFLAGLDSPLRRLCLIQHLLLQLAVLLILLPCLIAQEPAVPVFAFVLAGFALLWLAGAWSLFTRYGYAARLLSEHRNAALRKLHSTAAAEQGLEEGGPGHADH